MKAYLVLTCHQTRLSVQDCAPGNSRGRGLSRQSEEKLDGKCERVDVPSHGSTSHSS
ncbi:hypothetical protein DPMN_085199 [Dreissena polymorpha]|uniref:Uncharacterized protein n=1 Tax=Dreissena polymorpha TaxID=45954 RepID=A0A9D3YBY9_DREPO|nr:hypothetical protein DPMN_085199 [Dreissena polymorpha]